MKPKQAKAIFGKRLAAFRTGDHEPFVEVIVDVSRGDWVTDEEVTLFKIAANAYRVELGQCSDGEPGQVVVSAYVDRRRGEL